MADKKSFVFYDSWLPLFEEMDDQDAGKLIKAVCAYRHDPDAKPDNGYIGAMFQMIRKTIDADTEKYMEVCEKRAAYGKTGGLSKSKQKQAKGSKSKQKVANPDDKDKDNDKDKDKDINTKTQGAVNPELEKAIAYFIEHRKKLKKPMTDHAIDLFRERLNEMASTTQEQIALINLAIMKGWQTVYPDNENKGRASPTKKPSCPQRSYDFDDLERRLIKN